MITSTKAYTKENKNQKWTDRTLGHMIIANLYRQNHRKKHTHTHSQKEKKEKIYIKKKGKRATKTINKSTNENNL